MAEIVVAEKNCEDCGGSGETSETTFLAVVVRPCGACGGSGRA